MTRRPIAVFLLVVLLGALLTSAAGAGVGAEVPQVQAAPAAGLGGALGLTVQEWPERRCIGWGQRYTITVSNVGAQALGPVTVSDLMPPKTYPLLDRCSAGAMFDGGSRVSWVIATLGAGESRTLYMELGTYASFVPGELLVNTVTAEAEGVPSLTRTVSFAMESCQTPSPSPTAGRQPSLAVSLNGRSPQVCAGFSQRYDITVQNTGGQALTNVQAVDTLADGTYYLNSSHAGAYDGAQSVIWNLGGLAVGQSVSFYLEVGVLSSFPPGPLVNLVTVRSDQTAPVEARLTSQVIACPASTPTPGAGLTLRKIDWYDPWCPDWVQHYDLVVTNRTGATVTGLVLRDTIPATQARFWGATGGGTFDGVQTVTWNLGSLADGASITVRVDLRFLADLTPGTIVTNRSILTGDGLAPVNASAQTTVKECLQAQTPTPTPVDRHHLQVSLSGWHDLLCVHWNQRYTIAVTNTSDLPLTGVVVSDTLLSGTYVLPVHLGKSSPGATRDGDAVYWIVGTLPAHASLRLYLELGTYSWLSDGDVISNTVTVTANDSLPASAQASTTMSKQGECADPTATASATRIPSATPTATATCIPSATATATTTVTPTPAPLLPDLIVAEIAGLQEVDGCTAAPRIRVRVRNQGSGAAGGFWTTLVDAPEAIWYLEGLAAGQEHTFVSADLAPGSGEWTAVVDLYNDVVEADEGNNAASRSLTVLLPCTPTPAAVGVVTATPAPTLTPTPLPSPTGAGRGIYLPAILC